MWVIQQTICINRYITPISEPKENNLNKNKEFLTFQPQNGEPLLHMWNSPSKDLLLGGVSVIAFCLQRWNTMSQVIRAAFPPKCCSLTLVRSFFALFYPVGKIWQSLSVRIALSSLLFLLQQLGTIFTPCRLFYRSISLVFFPPQNFLSHPLLIKLQCKLYQSAGLMFRL